VVLQLGVKNLYYPYLSDISITFAWDNNHINLSSETVTFSGRRAFFVPRNLGLVRRLLIPKTLDDG